MWYYRGISNKKVGEIMDMDLFPEEYELIDIFESEPNDLDEDMYKNK